MINPNAPKFPIDGIEINHPQLQFVTRMGNRRVHLTGLSLDEANQYVSRLMNQKRYHSDLWILIKIRMNSDRIELRIPLTPGISLVYAANPIEQLLFQWLMMNWRNLSSKSLQEFITLNSTDIAEVESHPLPVSSKISSNSVKHSLFRVFRKSPGIFDK